MMLPINFVILKNPVNWFVIILTVMIGGFALHSIAPSENL